MRKKFRIVAIATVLALTIGLLAGCGGGQSAPPADTGTAAPADNGTAAPATDGQVYNLTLGHHMTDVFHGWQTMMNWVDQMKEESNGRLNIEVFGGGTLAGARDAVGMVQTGGMDMTFNTVSLNPALFQYPNLLGAFGEKITNSMIGTYAILQMYKNEPAISNEFTNANLKCLAIYGMTPSSLAVVGNKVETDNWKGLTLQSVGQNTIKIIEAFGATPQGVGTEELYENLSKNVVNGDLHDSALYQETRMYELLSYLNTFNFNTGVAFYVMNLDTFNSLPQDLQDIINNSFDDFSMSCGEATNNFYINFIENEIPKSNCQLYDFSPEMTAICNDKLKTVIADPYMEMVKADGKYDGDALYAEFEKYVDEGKAKYGSEYDWFKSLH